MRTVSNHDGALVGYQYDALNRLTKESYTGPKPSGCIELGSSDFVTVASGGDLAGSHPKMTVDMRIRLDAYPTGGNEAVLFERGTDGRENWFKLYIDSTGFLRVRVESDDSEKSQGVGTVPLGKWVHVAGGFDGVESDLWVMFDGIGSSTPHDGTLGSFGGNPKIGHGVFEGKIDEVHVRSAAVYAFDPMEDYTPDADTLGLWHFDETSGTTAYEDDTEGTKQNATVPSGAWSDNEGEFGVGSYAREYAYDKVGNRTEMRIYDEDGNFSRDIEWTLEYNDLNQLTKRYVGASWSGGTHRIEYDYDDNGNLTRSVEQTYGGVWSVSEEWKYDWNPRDQMTRAMKWAGSSGSTNNVGSVEHPYCLACDGAHPSQPVQKLRRLSGPPLPRG